MTLADMQATAEQAATLLADVLDRLHEHKRDVPDERREDVLDVADRAGAAWASTRSLIAGMRGLAGETR